MNIRQQVYEFHQAFGQPIFATPRVPEDERVRLRASLITEEYFETMRALFGNSAARQAFDQARIGVMTVVKWCTVQVDLTEVADGLADIDYVVEGTRLEFGIPGDAIAAEVHRSNMAKLSPCNVCGGVGCEYCNGIGKVAIRRDDGKILKPEGWTPPDIVGVLERQGRIR